MHDVMCRQPHVKASAACAYTAQPLGIMGPLHLQRLLNWQLPVQAVLGVVAALAALVQEVGSAELIASVLQKLQAAALLQNVLPQLLQGDHLSLPLPLPALQAWHQAQPAPIIVTCCLQSENQTWMQLFNARSRHWQTLCSVHLPTTKAGSWMPCHTAA